MAKDIDPRDIIARQAAQLDQAVACMSDFGRVLFGHFTAMQEAGFSHDEALTLTIAWQAAALAQTPGPEE